MICPKCHQGEFKTSRSEPYVLSRGRTYREMVCINCRARLETIEITMDDYNKHIGDVERFEREEMAKKKFKLLNTGKL